MKKLKGTIIEVVGAGQIKTSSTASCECGDVKGFSLETKWSGEKYFAGGVLSQAEAKKFADHIYKVLKLSPQ